jgi:hypothetical protein
MVVGDALRRHGIRAVLTGGACAGLHSDGSFSSLDVDFVLSGTVTQSQLDGAMQTVGFRRYRDRYVHPETRFFVEFVAGPLAVGSVAVEPIEHATGALRLLVLSPTDACRDRLAAFYHWNDRGSLDVAVAIASRNAVDMDSIRRWSLKEDALAKFEEFRRALK